MRLTTIFLCLALAAGSAILAGPDGFGRLALALGMNEAAAGLLSDPVARGVAHYRLGDYQLADDAFRDAGRSATYDRGLSLTATGNYALAVAYFDAALFADPGDEDARFNRGLVGALVPDVVGVSNIIDGVAANVQTEESEARASSRDMIQGAAIAEQALVADPRVDRAVAATTGWLATLTDEPGIYLKRRLRAEYERRQDLGLANPPEDTAW